MSGVGWGALLPLFSVEIVSGLHGGRCVGPELIGRGVQGVCSQLLLPNMEVKAELQGEAGTNRHLREMSHNLRPNATTSALLQLPDKVKMKERTLNN